ncbi:MAG: T9SS type A sorting domain-containing protein [Ignavibacteriales bacterium]|nr:T9SS type A sorting domain-containing protein [Ignavibacteriales bacterium]
MGFYNFEISNTVPVELISLTANVEKSTVMLNWITATEVNNSGFQIERRKTWEGKNSIWEAIGFINGNGTTTEINSYSYMDEELAAGKYNYRLKQIDFDGSFAYSDIVEVEVALTEFKLAQNYPNPFNPSTRIQFAVSSTQYVTLKVYDVLGNEIATLVDEKKSIGNYEVEFNANNLTSGVYFYQLKVYYENDKDGNSVQTKKMVLIK